MSPPLELFVALRYLRPRRTFVSTITILSVLGVTISVCVLIVVLSVMAGVRHTLDEKIIGFNAHITISSGEVIYDYDQLLDQIRSVPGVAAATGVVEGGVVAIHDGQVTQVLIKSAPSDGDDPVLPMKKFLVPGSGSYELRGDSVLVGYEWARENLAFPGDQVLIIGPEQYMPLLHQVTTDREDGQAHSGNPLRGISAKTAKSLALPETLTIRGIFRTGEFDYDQRFFLVSTETAQNIYMLHDRSLGDGIQQIAVRVTNPDEVNQVKDRLNRILQRPLQAQTWMDNNRDLFTALATERVTMTFVLFMVMVVAAFGLCTTLITITVQKSREIGLMKAIGATDFQVCTIFLLHGAVVGLLGALSGVLLSFIILHELNPFRLWLKSTFDVEVFAGAVYGATEIPSILNFNFVVLTALAALLMCLLAAFIPAWNAAKLAPAQALRYE